MMRFKSLPNTLTAIRIFLIPFIAVAFYQQKTVLTLVLILTACLTDWLDGHFARRLDAVSPLGTILDPVADKLFCMGLFSALLARELCPPWFLGLLISVNLLQLVAFVFVTFSPTRRQNVRPLRLGKWNTTLQFTWICALVAAALGVGARVYVSPELLQSMYLALGALQLVVFFRYLLVYRHVLLLAFRALSAVNS